MGCAPNPHVTCTTVGSEEACARRQRPAVSHGAARGVRAGTCPCHACRQEEETHHAGHTRGLVPAGKGGLPAGRASCAYRLLLAAPRRNGRGQTHFSIGQVVRGLLSGKMFCLFVCVHLPSIRDCIRPTVWFSSSICPRLAVDLSVVMSACIQVTGSVW